MPSLAVQNALYIQTITRSTVILPGGNGDWTQSSFSRTPYHFCIQHPGFKGRKLVSWCLHCVKLASCNEQASKGKDGVIIDRKNVILDGAIGWKCSSKLTQIVKSHFHNRDKYPESLKHRSRSTVCFFFCCAARSKPSCITAAKEVLNTRWSSC